MKINIGRNDPCWCGSGVKYKKCHEAFDHKLGQYARQGALVPDRDLIKTAEDIEGIKASAKINMEVLDYVGEHIRPGVTTAEIDRWVYEITTRRGGIPAPLNYEGFPRSVCTSIDEVVCHGIPDENRVLEEGQIINIDASTIYKGYFSDSSRMYMIGEVSPEKKRLVEITRQSIDVGLKEVKPWGFLGDMGQAIHEFCNKNGYSVVREIGGHGIGLEFHEDPYVSYVSRRGEEMMMVPGLCFTIEPMVNMGGPDIYVDADDGWTVYTDDDLPSAQWEVQLVVTEDGYELLSW